jgi:hypothetical protein
VPEWVRHYLSIDLEGLGRELAAGGNVVGGSGGAWVFEHWKLSAE